jgi:hypothetical protein
MKWFFWGLEIRKNKRKTKFNRFLDFFLVCDQKNRRMTKDLSFISGLLPDLAKYFLK